MVESKGWDWEKAESDIWLDPAEESYFFCEKWKRQGKRSVLDLGCGLGRHSILFAKYGFKVTACDISDYAVKSLRETEKKENLIINSKVCDMAELPFRENSFDCIFSYLAISHTDTEGFQKILSKLKNILKPEGEIYLTLCSKETRSFKEAGYPKIDENTVLKMEEGPENGIPHFFVNLEDIKRIFEPDFELLSVRHIDNCLVKGILQNNSHYHVWARIRSKEEKRPDFSSVIGTTVSGIIDRPIGSFHPKNCCLYYSVNYGYVEGIIAGDGEEQDVYYLGENKPVDIFSGRVIAVVHRFNDVEDKWVVAREGADYTKEDVEKAVEFQERFFDSEVIM